MSHFFPTKIKYFNPLNSIVTFLCLSTTPSLSLCSEEREEGGEKRKERKRREDVWSDDAHVWKSNIEGGVRARNFIHKSGRWMAAMFAVPDINCIYALCLPGSGYYDRSRRIISNPWHVTHTWLRLARPTPSARRVVLLVATSGARWSNRRLLFGRVHA